MNILERIVADKRIEVELKKSVLSLDYLRNAPLIDRDAFSLRETLLANSGIIAEFKRRSPSMQVINQKSSIVDVTK